MCARGQGGPSKRLWTRIRPVAACGLWASLTSPCTDLCWGGSASSRCGRSGKLGLCRATGRGKVWRVCSGSASSRTTTCGCAACGCRGLSCGCVTAPGSPRTSLVSEPVAPCCHGRKTWGCVAFQSRVWVVSWREPSTVAGWTGVPKGGWGAAPRLQHH